MSRSQSDHSESNELTPFTALNQLQTLRIQQQTQNQQKNTLTTRSDGLTTTAPFDQQTSPGSIGATFGGYPATIAPPYLTISSTVAPSAHEGDGQESDRRRSDEQARLAHPPRLDAHFRSSTSETSEDHFSIPGSSLWTGWANDAAGPAAVTHLPFLDERVDAAPGLSQPQDQALNEYVDFGRWDNAPPLVPQPPPTHTNPFNPLPMFARPPAATTGQQAFPTISTPFAPHHQPPPPAYVLPFREPHHLDPHLGFSPYPFGLHPHPGFLQPPPGLSVRPRDGSAGTYDSYLGGLNVAQPLPYLSPSAITPVLTPAAGMTVSPHFTTTPLPANQQQHGVFTQQHQPVGGISATVNVQVSGFFPPIRPPPPANAGPYYPTVRPPYGYTPQEPAFYEGAVPPYPPSTWYTPSGDTPGLPPESFTAWRSQPALSATTTPTTTDSRATTPHVWADLGAATSAPMLGGSAETEGSLLEEEVGGKDDRGARGRGTGKKGSVSTRGRSGSVQTKEEPTGSGHRSGRRGVAQVRKGAIVIPPERAASSSEETVRGDNDPEGGADGHDEEDEDDLEKLEDLDAAAVKRRRNTLAARRSRARKHERQAELERAVQELEERNTELVQNLASLETERRKWMEGQEAHQSRIRELEEQLMAVQDWMEQHQQQMGIVSTRVGEGGNRIRDWLFSSTRRGANGDMVMEGASANSADAGGFGSLVVPWAQGGGGAESNGQGPQSRQEDKRNGSSKNASSLG